MKKRTIPALCLACVFMAVLACEGGASGSVTNSSQTCQSIGNVVGCEGKFGKLRGTYSLEIEDDEISSADLIDVEARVSVESGTVKVSLQGSGGEVSSVQASPDRAATLVGVAEGDFGAFKITFEALEDEAITVRYNISYQIR
jgi:hypothetical protein